MSNEKADDVVVPKKKQPKTTEAEKGDKDVFDFLNQLAPSMKEEFKAESKKEQSLSPTIRNRPSLNPIRAVPEAEPKPGQKDDWDVVFNNVGNGGAPTTDFGGDINRLAVINAGSSNIKSSTPIAAGGKPASKLLPPPKQKAAGGPMKLKGPKEGGVFGTINLLEGGQPLGATAAPASAGGLADMDWGLKPPGEAVPTGKLAQMKEDPFAELEGHEEKGPAPAMLPVDYNPFAAKQKPAVDNKPKINIGIKQDIDDFFSELSQSKGHK